MSYQAFVISIMVITAILSGCTASEKEMINMVEFRIKSSAFEDNTMIPSKYTCDGENINPELIIENIPQGAKSLALIVDDPDAPMGTWDHWIVWNIPLLNKIGENSVPGIQGLNSWGRNDYGGPCPPSGTHRYFFKLYALDTDLDLDQNSTKSELEKAMSPHIIAKTQIIGLYKRS